MYLGVWRKYKYDKRKRLISGTHDEVTQTTNKQQFEKAIAELKDSNEAFINDLSKDLKL